MLYLLNWILKRHEYRECLMEEFDWTKQSPGKKHVPVCDVNSLAFRPFQMTARV